MELMEQEPSDQELRQAEHKLLCLAVRDAARLATHGEIAAGYRCLMAGLTHATDLESGGATWAHELARDYRAALRVYGEMVHDTRRAMYHLFFRYRPAPAVVTGRSGGYRHSLGYRA